MKIIQTRAKYRNELVQRHTQKRYRSKKQKSNGQNLAFITMQIFSNQYTGSVNAELNKSPKL